jgi:hypothetical protein
MSNRRKYEGEEDLQLRLLEVTEDPTIGDRTLRKKKISILLDVADDERNETDSREYGKLH